MFNGSCMFPFFSILNFSLIFFFLYYESPTERDRHSKGLQGQIQANGVNHHTELIYILK